MNKYLIKLFVIISFTSILVMIISCSGAKTDIIGEWEEESYQKGNIDKVLILGIFNKDRPLLRRNFENGMSEAFSDGGVTASPSMDHMPYDETVDSTTFEKYFKDLEFDAVVVSRLVGLEQNRDYKAGYLYTIPFNSYYGFYGYYYAIEIFIEQLVKRGHLSLYDLGYYIFCRGRYFLTRGLRYPMYYHWYKFK